MKKFGTLLLSAVLGSAFTIGGFQLFQNNEKSIKIEHLSTPPVVGATYTVNKNGEFIPLEFTDVSKKVMPAVVHIKSTQLQNSRNTSPNEVPDPFRQFFHDDLLRDFFGPRFQYERRDPRQRGPQARIGTGSGVIISEDGYIVTNNHVIDKADDIEVTLNDNRVYKAKIIGVDPSTDLALLQIKEKNLAFLPFIDSDQIEVGEWVLAIGNPFNLNSTVTAGIVSAKARNINILQNRNAIESFIQTDAAINPGNSGGALVDLKGGLVGINTAIASPTGAYSGYGFAIPSNIVSKIVEDLMTYGVVQRGYLGIVIRSVDGNLAKEKELDVTEGVYVDSLTNKSAAAEAGIKTGDVILKVDQSQIKSTAELLEIVGQHRPGDKLEISVDRKGKRKDFTVTLLNEEGKTKITEKGGQEVFDLLGIKVEEINPELAKKLGIPGGIKVTKLYPGKLQRNTNLKEGFIITKIDGNSVQSLEELRSYLEQKKGGIMLEGVYEDYPGTYYYAFGLS